MYKIILVHRFFPPNFDGTVITLIEKKGQRVFEKLFWVWMHGIISAEYSSTSRHEREEGGILLEKVQGSCVLG